MNIEQPSADRLTDVERQLLGQLRRKAPIEIILGGLLMLAGCFYAVWGARQLNPARVDDPHPAFDRPIAQLETLLVRPQQERLRRIQPHTKQERQLLDQLMWHTRLAGRLLVLLFRILFGTVLAGMGATLLAIGLTEWQFVAMLDKLQ